MASSPAMNDDAHFPPFNHVYTGSSKSPNGLDSRDLRNLWSLLSNLDAYGTVFDGTAEIRSNDQTIKVRVWHDSEVHRIAFITC